MAQSIYPDREGKAFDKQEIFEAQVRPLVEQIMQVCTRENIPALMSFCAVNNGGVETLPNLIYKSMTGPHRQFGPVLFAKNESEEAA